MADAPAPRVSVIVPAFHSDSTIGACVDGLLAQTFTDFEAIFVNSSQEERTGRIVAARFPHARFEQSPERLLPHAARNRGVALARGELLVFTDPDCVPEPEWLRILVASSERGHGVVVGAMDLIGGSAYECTVHLCKFAPWLPGAAEGPRTIAPTANALYTREAWEAVGAFREDVYSGDTLQSWRATARGFPPWFEPKAIVAHRHGGELRSFLRERRVRGEDFAQLRMVEERHSRAWAAAHLIAFPALPFLELGRVGRRAVASGWGRAFVRTTPLQLAANTAWALGEVRAHARAVVDRSPRP